MTLNEANRVARVMERQGFTITALRQDLDGTWEVDGSMDGKTVTATHAASWLTPAPAAGRPPVYGETMVPHTIRMTTAQWAHVRQQGGDLSAGARAIVQRDMEGER